MNTRRVNRIDELKRDIPPARDLWPAISAAIEADRKKGIIRKRKSIQQNLDAGANPIPGRANPNDEQ